MSGPYDITGRPAADVVYINLYSLLFSRKDFPNKTSKAWPDINDYAKDITIRNVPLFYYPGSHRLPFLFNSDYDNDSSLLTQGNKTYTDYKDKVRVILQQNNFHPAPFKAKKGMCWYGMPISYRREANRR
ncbi:MAG: hypothetical protein JST63_07480 [Bacteroidetes bacterium]|nr:hypothetical protein [Bacteroidota bacterium]